MFRVLAAIDENGARAFRVFSRESGVFLRLQRESPATWYVGDLAWSHSADIFRPRRTYTFHFTPRPCHI